MADLLLQGYPKTIKNDGINREEISPMFRTGLGKSVAVKQSSLSKASSIVRDEVNLMANRVSPDLDRHTSDKRTHVTDGRSCLKTPPVNLIKRPKDQLNHLWVAEVTENSTYSLTYDQIQCSHLKEAAASAQMWAKFYSLTIEKLKGKILSIIGNCKG